MNSFEDVVHEIQKRLTEIYLNSLSHEERYAAMKELDPKAYKATLKACGLEEDGTSSRTSDKGAQNGED